MSASTRRLGLILAALAALAPPPAVADDPIATEFDLRRLRGPRADVAALMLGGRESGSLRVAARAAAGCPAEGSAAPVELQLEVETASLLDAVESAARDELPASVRLELYAYALGRTGGIAVHLSEWVRLPLVDLTRHGGAGGVKIATGLELEPGEYQIRALLREASSQLFALRLIEIEVPAPDARTPYLAPPSFAGEGRGWLVARPAVVAGDPAPPAALPVLAPGRSRSLTLAGCRLEGASFSARLLSREREEVAAAVELEIDAESSGPGGAPARLVAPEVEPGLYLLELSARAEEGGSTAVVPVFVTPAPDVESIVAWTELGGAGALPSEAAERAETEARSGPRTWKREAALADGYRRALELLSLGRLEEAVTALRALETGALAGERPQRELKRLAEAQNRVTRELLSRDPECLLPLLVLHIETEGRYAADEDVDNRLLEAARTRIRSLAHVYASEADTEMAPALAAGALVELAETLEGAGRLVSSLVVLREALTLDPANARAILDLAYQYEHHGFQDDARAMLERLIELDPRSDEGRLRLAMSRLRAGQSGDAETLLSAVIAEGTVDWVLAVAYQELARLLFRQQRFDEAVRLLRGAVVRLPDVQRLYVELAYALDRNGERGASSEIATRLPSDRGEPSPRLLYRVRPKERGTGTQTELVRHGLARLPRLAAALGQMGESG